METLLENTVANPRDLYGALQIIRPYVSPDERTAIVLRAAEQGWLDQSYVETELTKPGYSKNEPLPSIDQDWFRATTTTTLATQRRELYSAFRFLELLLK